MKQSADLCRTHKVPSAAFAEDDYCQSVLKAAIGYEFLFFQKPARDLPRASEPRSGRSIGNAQTRLPAWHT